MEDENRNNPGNFSWVAYMSSPYGQSSMGPPHNLSAGLQEVQQSQGTQQSFSQMLRSQPTVSEPVAPSSSQSSQTTRENWSQIEDMHLCHAWKRVSSDPIIGSDQKKNSFWGRVFEEFKKEHEEGECIRRNQKACDLRMQHIKADLKKWSAALKKVLDCPPSGMNLYNIQQTAHTYYERQHKKRFRLEHCWAILSQCPTFVQSIGSAPPIDFASYVTPPRRPSHSATNLEELNLSGVDAQREVELRETPLHEGAQGSARSNNDVLLDDMGDEHHSPPLRTRPPGRKASKCAKRQASVEAQSVAAERVAKSLEDMTTSNSVMCSKATELHEQQIKKTNRKKDIQAILGMIAIEKESAALDKILLDTDPSALGSPSEKSRILAEYRSRVAELRAQAAALIAAGNELGSSTATGAGCNLLSRFDDV